MNTLAQNGIGIRVPPQNIEAEQAVLGSILLKDKAFSTVLEIIGGIVGLNDRHQVINQMP